MEAFDASDVTWEAANIPPITYAFDGVDWFEVNPDGTRKPIEQDTQAIQLADGCSVAFFLR